MPTNRCPWEILSQRAIGVLVPRCHGPLRIAKIDVDFSRHRKAPMIRKLFFPGPGSGIYTVPLEAFSPA